MSIALVRASKPKFERINVKGFSWRNIWDLLDVGDTIEFYISSRIHDTCQVVKIRDPIKSIWPVVTNYKDPNINCHIVLDLQEITYIHKKIDKHA